MTPIPGECHPTDGTIQTHLNTPPTDVDWVKFYATAGHNYDIRTMLLNDINQSDTAANDTLLYLYASDGVTQLAFNDDVRQRHLVYGALLLPRELDQLDGRYERMVLRPGTAMGPHGRQHHPGLPRI